MNDSSEFIKNELEEIDRGFIGQLIAVPDLLVLVERVEAEVKLLRIELGSSAESQVPFEVKEATLRDTYSLAHTLYRKVNRLNFEKAGQFVTLPDLKHEKLEAMTIYRVVMLSLNRILHLKAELGITSSVKLPERQEGGTLTQVFMALARASRLMNELLESKILPRDVFQTIERGSDLLETVLQEFESHQKPPLPSLERRKQPRDVYKRLASCYEKLSNAMEISGIPCLHFEIIDTSGIAPADVYDLASLLLSDIVFVGEQLETGKGNTQWKFPGVKTPSDVYQLAGLLHLQLLDFEQRVAEHPDWADVKNQ